MLGLRLALLDDIADELATFTNTRGGVLALAVASNDHAPPGLTDKPPGGRYSWRLEVRKSRELGHEG